MTEERKRMMSAGRPELGRVETVKLADSNASRPRISLNSVALKPAAAQHIGDKMCLLQSSILTHPARMLRPR